MRSLERRIEVLEKYSAPNQLTVVIRSFDERELSGYRVGHAVLARQRRESEEDLIERAIKTHPAAPLVVIHEIRALI